MERKVLAVETGGSKFITGVVKEGEEKIYGRIEEEITYKSTEEYLSAIISSMTRSLEISEFEESDIDAIGVVSAGKWSKDRQFVDPPNLPFDHDEVPLGREIMNSFELPVFAENDVNAGVLAEVKFGAGMEFGGRYIGYLTISSGIGLGLYDKKHREFFSGEHGQAPEVGHNKLMDKGFECGCGGHGHWEAYGSGNGLENIFRSISGESRDAREILENCEDGDCDRAVSMMAYYNAMGVGQVINSYQPGMLIFGGSPVFHHPEKVFKRMEEVLKSDDSEFSFIDDELYPEMKVSELGEDNVLFGAAAVALEGREESRVNE